MMAIAEAPGPFVTALLWGLLGVWISALVFAGCYMYASYQMALVRTPPWWIHCLGDVPYQLLQAAIAFAGKSHGR